MSNKVITLYEIPVQEEIFCKFFIHTLDVSISAYEAGYFKLKESELKYPDLKSTDKAKLTRKGNELIKEKRIKKRISEMTEQEAVNKNILSLDDTLEYLSLVIKEAKKKLKSSFYTNCGLRAAEIIIRHHKENNNNKNEQIYFSRFSK
jgi:hypothetical protein